MEEATHAFDVDAGREGYSARRSSMIVSTSAVADGSAKDDEHKAAISHAQRLQLVRHALRSLYKADIESLAKIAKPEFPLLVLAGAVCSTWLGCPPLPLLSCLSPALPPTTTALPGVQGTNHLGECPAPAATTTVSIPGSLP